MRESFSPPSDDLVRTELAKVIGAQGTEILPWPDNILELLTRVRWLRERGIAPEGAPDLHSETLKRTISEWLLPYLQLPLTKASLERTLQSAFDSLLPFSVRKQIEAYAPSVIEVPSGSRIKVSYEQEEPTVSVRLQEIFGLRETPRIAGGRISVMMNLLSPGFRPVQKTKDLASFWKCGYFEVKKELRTRYPKHSWPEDPLSAPPIRGPKKKGRP